MLPFMHLKKEADPFPPDLFVQLQTRLNQALPGEEAQYRMSGNRLYSTSEYLIRNPAHRQSAVLILLWPEAGNQRCLLIRRPEYEGAHSGQMALPGGQREETDGDLLETALRETREETGVIVSRHEVAGALSPLYIPVSNFRVQPYVAVLAGRPVFDPDPAEVSALVDFRLDLLLDPGVLKIKERVWGNGMKAETPYFDIEGSDVWGATAMILSELAAVLEAVIFS